MKPINFSFYLLILLAFSSILAINNTDSSTFVTSSIEMEDKIPYSTFSKLYAKKDAFSVLVDWAHSEEVFIPANDSPIGTILARSEYEVTPLLKGDNFNQSLLETADVVMIQTQNPTRLYTQAEIDALTVYWKGGGSLLLAGVPNVDILSRPNRGLNRILSSVNS